MAGGTGQAPRAMENGVGPVTHEVEGFLLVFEVRDALIGYLQTKPMNEVRRLVEILERLAPIKGTVTEATAAEVWPSLVEDSVEE